MGGHLFAHEGRSAGRPRGGPARRSSEARSYGVVRSPAVAEITGAGREWTVSMITLYADVRIGGVIRTSALSEAAACTARGAGVCLVVRWDNALVSRGALGARALSGPAASRASGGMPRSIPNRRVLASGAAARGSGSFAGVPRVGRSR